MKKLFKSKYSLITSLILIGAGFLLMLIGYQNDGLQSVYFSRSGFHIPSLEISETYEEKLEDVDTLSLDLSDTNVILQTGSQNTVKGAFRKTALPQKEEKNGAVSFQNAGSDTESWFLFSFGDRDLNNIMIITINPDHMPKKLTVHLQSGSFDLFMDTDQNVSFDQIKIVCAESYVSLQNLKTGNLSVTSNNLYLENLTAGQVSVQTQYANLDRITVDQSLNLQTGGYSEFESCKMKKAEITTFEGGESLIINDGTYGSLSLKGCSPTLSGTEIENLTLLDTPNASLDEISVSSEASISGFGGFSAERSSFQKLKGHFKYDSATFSDVKAVQSELELDQENLYLDGRIEGNFTIKGRDSWIQIMPEAYSKNISMDLKASEDGQMIIDGQSLFGDSYQQKVKDAVLKVNADITGGTLEFFFDR